MLHQAKQVSMNSQPIGVARPGGSSVMNKTSKSKSFDLGAYFGFTVPCQGHFANDRRQPFDVNLDAVASVRV